MPTAIKIWEISGETLKSAVSDELSTRYIEAELENWIANNTELLGEEILIIDRQRDVPGVGRIDLLGIDRDGTVVIVELKRDRASREAVAQALDYASWLDSESPETVEAFADDYLKKTSNKNLSDTFSEKFGADGGLPEIACQNHRILLVAARLDVSAERIINYLAERYGVDINAAFFTYSRLSDGKEVLARSMLVPDGTRRESRVRKQLSVAASLSVAAERKVLPLVEVCRKIRDFWQETRGPQFGGSFLYWATHASGARKSVFGIIPLDKYGTPTGQLDVHVNVKNLSDITGISEDAIRETLKSQHPAMDVSINNSPGAETWGPGEKAAWTKAFWLRLSSVAEAQAMVDQLRKWVPQAATGAPA